MQSLGEFFGQRRRLLVGVDISDTQVRLVSLSRHAGRFRVEGYCIGELEQGAVEEGVIREVDVVAYCLKRLVKRMGIKTHAAALAIKSGAAFTKGVMFEPTLTRREIEELMLVEAESSLPYALDEVYLDYAMADETIAGAQLLGVSRFPNSLSVAAHRHQKMLLVACKHDVLDPRVRAAEQAQLQVEAVDLESFALQRALFRRADRKAGEHSGQQLAEQTGLVALILLESTLSSVHLFRGGEHKLSWDWRRKQAGAASALGSLPLDIDASGLDDFDAYIRGETRGKTSDVGADRCQAIANEIATQVRLAISQLPSDDVASALSLVILGGVDAQAAGLAATTAESLLCQVELANPFLDMTLAEDLDPLIVDQDAPLLMVACGLALRKVG